MKLKFTTIAFFSLLISAMCFAQPTLTETNVGFKPNLTYTFENTTYPTPLTTGTNHTWNFGSVTSTGSNLYKFDAPSSFSQGSSFPSANIAYSAGGVSEFYYNTNATKLELVGVYANGNIFTFTNPETWMQYPFTFGNTFTDTWACHYTNGVTFNRGGTTTVTADGYGTITLPNGSYSNVLRVALNQIYADTASSMVLFNYVSNNIQWYMPGVAGFGIASRGELTLASMGQPGQTVIIDAYMNPITPTSVKDIRTMESFIDFYPNPANDVLHIKAAKIDNGEIVICNMSGATVVKQRLSKLASAQVDVSNLSAGQYLMHLSVDGQNVAGEIITIKH